MNRCKRETEAPTFSLLLIIIVVLDLLIKVKVVWQLHRLRQLGLLGVVTSLLLVFRLVVVSLREQVLVRQRHVTEETNVSAD